MSDKTAVDSVRPLFLSSFLCFCVGWLVVLFLCESVVRDICLLLVVVLLSTVCCCCCCCLRSLCFGFWFERMMITLLHRNRGALWVTTSRARTLSCLCRPRSRGFDVHITMFVCFVFDLFLIDCLPAFNAGTCHLCVMCYWWIFWLVVVIGNRASLPAVLALSSLAITMLRWSVVTCTAGMQRTVCSFTSRRVANQRRSPPLLATWCVHSTSRNASINHLHS